MAIRVFAPQTVADTIQGKRFKGSGTPSVSAGAGLGSTPTISLTTNSNNSYGEVNFTPGGSGIAAGDLFTVNYDTAYPTAPFPTFSPSNEATAFDSYDLGAILYVSSYTTTGFTVGITAALNSGTPYKLTYHVGQ